MAAGFTIGAFVFIAPNVVITTAGHTIDRKQRDGGLEIALLITIGSHVWLGANVCVLPSVIIGDNVVIGTGAVVTKYVPSDVVAAANPCRILRSITEKDKSKYPVFKEYFPRFA